MEKLLAAIVEDDAGAVAGTATSAAGVDCGTVFGSDTAGCMATVDGNAGAGEAATGV